MAPQLRVRQAPRPYAERSADSSIILTKGLGSRVYSLLAAGQFADDFDFALAVWGSVRMKDVVKPDDGLAIDVGMLP
jgi:hypothetical protein